MKNSIGGLFKKKNQAEQAYRALQEAGFQSGEIALWVHKEDVPLNYEHRVSPLEIGISAGIGAVIVGIIAAIVGLLISLGDLQIPGFIPNFARGPYEETIAFGLFIVQGAITGAILGAAIRLLTSRENTRITSTGIKRGGVLVTVDADETQREVAEQVMQANGALDLEDLTEKWDSKVWAGFKEVRPS